jgi:hypothetical protein
MLADQGHLLALFLLYLFLLHRVQRVKKVWQAFGDLPAHTVLVSPVTIFSRILPRIPWISGGADFSWRNVYERMALLRIAFPTQLIVHI